MLYDYWDSAWVHIDDVPNLDHAREHIQGMLDALYGNQGLEFFEFNLEEVLSVLGMTIPSGQLRIRK